LIPKTPPALRRKLDRLARRAHAFHRYAHHPLCVEYADERIQIGRIRLCRGCALLGIGLLSGFAAGIALRPHLMSTGLALIPGIAIGLLSFHLRTPKTVGRLLPGAALAFAAVQGLRLGPMGWALSMAAGAVFAIAVFLYRRRGPNRGPCETCRERDRRPACRGFAPVLRRERALQRLAGRLIAKDLQRN
jgi:hypothetical protein